MVGVQISTVYDDIFGIKLKDVLNVQVKAELIVAKTKNI